MCVMENGSSVFTVTPTVPFYQKENFCERFFSESGPYWHLCTPGMNQEIIFSNREEMVAGMNLLAVTAVEFPMVIFTECLMNNHLHMILSCEEEVGYRFFKVFRRRLARFLHSNGSCVDLENFYVDRMIPIDSLDQMRQEVVYVNRNGYVANRNCNPFSYPWGAGCLYFNSLCTYWTGVSVNDMSSREQRHLLRGRPRVFNRQLSMKDGMILPSSYCSVKDGERFFRDSWHYFSMLSKNYEAYGSVAKRLSDSNFLTDEEVYPAVKSICMVKYNVKQPRSLPEHLKREMIIYMHNELSSTNDQIRRILNVDISLVNELFPLSAKRESF